MNQISAMHTFLICLNLCVFCVILLSERSSGADYRFEACVPAACGRVNVSYPFYIPGLQESFCGFPRFQLNCSNLGFPVLELSENEFVVEDISYQNRTFRVYDSAVLSSNVSSCSPRIRNTTLYATPFNYVNATRLRLFSNCSKPLAEDFSRDRAACNGKGSDDWDLALFDDGEGDEKLRAALENCGRNVVAPVDRRAEEGNDGIGNLVEVLGKGFELNWTATHCDSCERSGGRCGFDESDFRFRCFCPDRPHSRSCKSGKNLIKVILAATIPGCAFLVCLLVCLLIWRSKKGITVSRFLSRNVSYDPASKSGKEGGNFYFGIPIFSYTELVEATSNFESSKELGDGGFGTVYYGKLKDGREVAVKRLYEHNFRRMEQFMNEIKILSCLRHPNLVSLYGCTSRKSRELLLVYEYVCNGTVADHLHGERAKEGHLPWAARMNIAIETAAALSYLHKSDIIHRDVKTNNILLDENFSVKVADFGLSRLFPNDATHISTAPQGSPGYVDPEYHQYYQLTDKSDVYSFGVVLFELISSMPAVDINRHRHEINLANLALNKIQRCAFHELIDPSLGYDTEPEVKRMANSMAGLAFRCLQLEKEMRPAMDEVLDFLKDVQSGDEVKFEKAKQEICYGRIPPSPEKDDAVLLKNKNFPSPNTVTHKWISSGSTTSGSIE